MLSPTKRQHENNQLYYYMPEIIMDQINMLPCGVYTTGSGNINRLGGGTTTYICTTCKLQSHRKYVEIQLRT